jgi:hypothetical protein
VMERTLAETSSLRWTFRIFRGICENSKLASRTFATGPAQPSATAALG